MKLRGNRVLISVSALLAGALYLCVGAFHQPLHHWLLWQLISLWGLACIFAAASLALGHALAKSVLRLSLGIRLHLLMSFALGVLGFSLGIFLFGLAGVLFPWIFYAWPGILLITLGPRLVRYLSGLLQRWRRLRLRFASIQRTTSPLSIAIRAFGVLGFVLLYLQVLTPENIAFDARWYHLSLAERYAATAEIARTPEGWFQGTLPQLATWLFSWAMLVPGADLAFKLRLVGHLELVLLMATAAGVPLLARHLSKGRVCLGAWPALFLFSGIFLYDSNLNGSADHVHAFWAIPIALSYVQVIRRADVPSSLLFGTMVAGAVNTKYQASYMIVGLAVLSGVHLVTHHLSQGAAAKAPSLGKLTRAVGLAVLTTLIVTSPHWLRNAVLHHNPLYPFAHSLFGGVPWEVGTQVRIQDPGWRPEGPWPRQLWHTAKATLSFSLTSHDWSDFHGNQPVFGALFPLVLAPLLFVSARHRIWRWAAATFAGVAMWYWTYHQDRYLQALVPWMAAIVAASLGLLWQERSRWVRGAVGFLVAVQVVWAADIPFLPTHAMIDGSPYEKTLRLASTSFRRAYKEQFEPATGLPKVVRKLPKSAVILAHERYELLGLARRAVSDMGGRQGGISYENLGSSMAIFNKLSAIGITHVLWSQDSQGVDSFGADLLFYEYVSHLRPVKTEGLLIAKLEPPPESSLQRPLLASVLGCKKRKVFMSLSELHQGITKWGDHGCGDPISVRGVDVEASRQSRFVIVRREFPTRSQAFESRGYRLLFERDGWVALGAIEGTEGQP